MFDVKRDFSGRKQEVEDFFSFLDQIIGQDAKISIGDEGPKRLKVGLTTTLKSSAILLLYNLVESTVTNLLQAIHRNFSDENLRFDDLSKEIQAIWFDYYYFNLKDGNIKDADIMFKVKMIHDAWSGMRPINLTFEDYTKYKNRSIYAGSLDAREIKKILKKYGVPELRVEAPGLKAVKEKRNKLAHGELSFSECSRDMVPVYLNKLKVETILFLESAIEIVDDYISNKMYRRSP